jgi:hypothetical protein
MRSSCNRPSEGAGIFLCHWILFLFHSGANNHDFALSRAYMENSEEGVVSYGSMGALPSRLTCAVYGVLIIEL